MDADHALNDLFLRKMNCLSAENTQTIDDLREFYERNEAKLIGICARHKDDKKFHSLRLFVSFEFKEHHPEHFPPPLPREEAAPQTAPHAPRAGSMTLVAEGEEVETRGNPDGVIEKVKNE